MGGCAEAEVLCVHEQAVHFPRPLTTATIVGAYFPSVAERENAEARDDKKALLLENDIVKKKLVDYFYEDANYFSDTLLKILAPGNVAVG